MKRCVIIGGAGICDYSAVKTHLSDRDFYIFCDSGLFHEKGLGVSPDLIVGDFDSHRKPDRNIETIVLPREKDDTDTFFAVKEAIARGFSEFLIVGACGGRLDHTFGNISILLYLHKSGLDGKIVDDFSEMEIVAENPKYIDGSFPFFSVINIDGSSRGITIKNAKFPLENAEITCDYQYGISNEVLPGKTAEVSVSNGAALLICVRKA
ncbi:MAG: thiamine diphosphokinase [Oscillospiraceae bacterium]|nr:thiamine diphosphokinase [Oscillospiraceae bacterium]